MARRKHDFGGLSMSDAELMAAALFGLEHQQSAIEGRIAELRRIMRETDLSGSAVPRKRRPMSAAGRKRIAAAQRKRWAAVKKAKKGAKET